MAGFMDWVKSTTQGLKDSVARFKNDNFAEAIVAACAIVAAADGNIGSEEKQKMAGFIGRSDDLKVFDMNDLINRFKRYTDGFEFDYTIGKAEALKAIGKLKSNQEAGKLLVRVCCAVGAADGNFDDKEKAMVREIVRELGLKVEDFPGL